MQSLPKKPCRYCKETLPKHWPFQCKDNPQFGRLKLKRKKAGKTALTWQRTRRFWLQENKQESYSCFYCGRFLWSAEVTLDHYHSRSRHPELRYELTNLVPCCYLCNGEKGSIDGDDFKKV